MSRVRMGLKAKAQFSDRGYLVTWEMKIGGLMSLRLPSNRVEELANGVPFVFLP
ncbi:MAG: hypothetical protein M1404_05585 [Acidobacteria bacterium]|nr:hypothetical protein [Acidobacteriota bacterium]